MIRILTEDINRENIHAALASASIDAYTLIPCEGSWKGVREKSLIIELDGVTRFQAECTERIRTANKQEAVLVQEIQATSFLVTPKPVYYTRSTSTPVSVESENGDENEGILRLIGIHPSRVYSDYSK
jgi:hypothetical protein